MVEERMGDKDHLGSTGKHSTLRWDRGLLFGPEGKTQGSRIGWGRE